MIERKSNPPQGTPGGLEEQVQKKAARRRWAAAQKKRTVWFGFGMFGLIGWSVAIPTVLGAVLGIWLDRHWPAERISWTLSLLFVGILLGCINAWRWVSRERKFESRPDFRAESIIDETKK
ncbi:MAG: AtpZ/AtpI family protein [Gammaproteobacteria bacterium]|jgi:ATP synthase protein I|nr:AtpZ/AtpI family protein [Gammaproteobacteria bacterium]